jgi:cytochrome c-type protein NapB
MNLPTDNAENSSQDAVTPHALGDFTQRHAKLIALALVGIATTGYFIGLKAPMTANSDQPSPSATALHSGTNVGAATEVIPATHYAEMHHAEKHPNLQRSTRLATLQQTVFDPGVKIEVNEGEKVLSLVAREKRRAFNGAPPTVPHAIDQLNSASCMACHGKGLRSKSLRAGKMPHPYYSSCTQCHVEQQAKFAPASATFENAFAGVTAPTHGNRAYQGAPPVIPHNTWMRNDCLSCHGHTAAPGMATTHPWSTSCLQCHGESSALNQTKLGNVPHFLPLPAQSDHNE